MMIQNGMAKVAQSIANLCDMPMEWSALHGYAEIRTPIFKIVTKTDATPFEYKFQKPGIYQPVHAGSGLAFPFTNEQRVKLTETASFHKSLATLEFPPDDNGFPSERDERDAHAWLMKEIEQFMNPSEKKSLVDLGCGNGRLLQFIHRRYQAYSLSGVEVSIDKVKRAEKLLTGSGIQIECKNIFQYDMVRKDYILVSEQRFQENHHLAEKLDGTIICYNYTTRRVYTWNSATTGMEILKQLTGFGDNTTQTNLDSQIKATGLSPASLIVEKELKASGLLKSLPKGYSS
jgi:Predicted O-methyltransferase